MEKINSIPHKNYFTYQPYSVSARSCDVFSYEIFNFGNIDFTSYTWKCMRKRQKSVFRRHASILKPFHIFCWQLETTALLQKSMFPRFRAAGNTLHDCGKKVYTASSASYTPGIEFKPNTLPINVALFFCFVDTHIQVKCEDMKKNFTGCKRQRCQMSFVLKG